MSDNISTAASSVPSTFPPPPKLIVVDHPLVQHKLTLMRRKETSTGHFRRFASEIGLLLGYEATRHLATRPENIETPLEPMVGSVLEGKKVVLVPVLRAGLVISDALLELIPSARVGHFGLYRNEATLKPVEYFNKVPKSLDGRDVVVCDPMLATGGSALATFNMLKKRNTKSLTLVSIVGSPEGVAEMREHHPDVTIVIAAIDRCLNEKGYILPGLGDMGDRLYGTK